VMNTRSEEHNPVFYSCFAYFVNTATLSLYVFVSYTGVTRRNEQALVCLSNRETVDASRGCTFHCKMTNNRFFSNCFGLIYLAIYPPSIITANVRPPSASTDFFNFSETRACSYVIRFLVAAPQEYVNSTTAAAHAARGAWRA